MLLCAACGQRGETCTRQLCAPQCCALHTVFAQLLRRPVCMHLLSDLSALGTLPSGLGASAAFAVGAISLLHFVCGEEISRSAQLPRCCASNVPGLTAQCTELSAAAALLLWLCAVGVVQRLCDTVSGDKKSQLGAQWSVGAFVYGKMLSAECSLVLCFLMVV